mmetsp:Transcript_25174/g.69426  ORF Transcript_25174/g.69426 Transcript_25174/m.69426 type:complete len:389 (+) Transcript_25174:285-1451(+)
MKLFQKRRDDTGMEQRGSPGADYRLDNNAKHNFDKAGIYHGDKIPAFHQDLTLPSTLDEQQMLNIATMRNAPTLIGNESPKNRQSIAGLVRKLNCSSSSKKNDEASFNQYPAGVGGVAELVGFSGDQRETKGGSSSNKVSTSAILSDITRPVLITVKDSDANPSSTQSGRKSNNHSPTETGNAFVVGGVPSRTTSSSRLGMSARKRQHNEKEINKNRGGGIMMGNTSNHNRSKNNHTTSKDPDTKRTAQELARRQRWKRGLEMELFRNSSIAKRSNGRDIDDESWADSVTQGSQTTSSSYDDTTENSSSVDDWTDSTDESRVYPRRHQYRHGSSNTGGQCLQNEKIARSLAKDVGIIASFLMADGYACLGTAAEITKETVASCRRNGL